MTKKNSLSSILRFGFFSLCLLTTAALFTACGDDDDDDMGPRFSNTKTFAIDGKTYNIQSVGYYFDSEHDNFNIIFSADNQDLSHRITAEPSAYIKINIPQEKCNITADLTLSLNSASCIFYLQVADGSYAAFTKGKIFVRVTTDNKIKAYIDGIAYDGPELYLAYEGNAVRSNEEIW